MDQMLGRNVVNNGPRGLALRPEWVRLIDRATQHARELVEALEAIRQAVTEPVNASSIVQQSVLYGQAGLKLVVTMDPKLDMTRLDRLVRSFMTRFANYPNVKGPVITTEGQTLTATWDLGGQGETTLWSALETYIENGYTDPDTGFHVAGVGVNSVYALSVQPERPDLGYELPPPDPST